MLKVNNKKVIRDLAKTTYKANKKRNLLTIVAIFLTTFLLCTVISIGLSYWDTVATVYKGNIIKNLIMDCQSYTKYRPNETTGGIFVSWRRKEELPTGA